MIIFVIPWKEESITTKKNVKSNFYNQYFDKRRNGIILQTSDYDLTVALY